MTIEDAEQLALDGARPGASGASVRPRLKRRLRSIP